MRQKASLQVSGKTYQVIREIGSGSFGVVYLVEDDKGKKFALKALHIRPAPAQIDAFKDEFRLLTQLRHPYLCAAHGFAYSDELKNYLFVSDYAPGKPFFEATEGRSPEEVERLAVQALEVLDYLHLHGVIHFDVKCPNILVQADGTIRLLDFGFAHLQTQPLTKFPGSFRYAAPEIFLRSSSTDGRADLYSLGMVLYRALARRFPFSRDDDPMEIMDWHLHRSISWTPEQCQKIPAHLRQLADYLMKKSPAERLSRARAAINWINLHTEDRYRAPASEPHFAPLEGPLMAREGEIAAALKCLETGSSGVVVFLGEKGVGKSRLLREIKYAAEVQEFRCLWLDNFSEKDGIFQISQQLDLSSVRFPDEFYKQSIAKLQKGQPTVLFIDDAHDADPLVLEWVLRVHQEGLLEALFLGWEGPIPSHGLFAPIFHAANVLFLAPLTREHLKTYITDVLADPEKEGAWLDPLYEFSSGLPLLVAEGLRYLLDNPGRRRLPPSIGKLYGDSLSSLSLDALILLEGLSLWKRAASIEELSRTVSLEIPRIVPLIPPLLSKGLISTVSFFEDRSLHYRISNAALALVLQERQTPSQKEERTKKILEALEAGGASSLEELASYASHSGDVAKARDYLLRLGEHYEASFHTQKAIQTYQEILSRFAGDGPELIALVRKKLIPLLVLAGRPEEALALFPDGAKLDLADRKLKGWVLTRSGRFSEAEALYQEGVIGSSAEDPLHRDLLNALANIYLQTHQVEKALQLFRRTLPSDAATDEEKLKILKNNNNLGLALALSGKFDEALAFEKGKLALFKKQGDDHEVASILSQLGFIELKAQNLSQATLYLEESLALSERLGDLHNILILLDNLIFIFQRRGLYREALSAFSKAVSYRGVVSPAYQRIQNHLKGAFLYLTIGLPEPAKSHLDRIDALLSEAPSRASKGWAELAWGYYYRASGLPEEAARRFENAIMTCQEDKEDSLRAWGHYALADLWFERKKGNEAFEEYRKATDNLPQLADEELQLRMKLLSLLLQRDGFLHEANLVGPLERLKQLGEECEKKGMAEIAAEAYLAAQDPRAEALYRKIASHLPEEYKIAYENLRLRHVEV